MYYDDINQKLIHEPKAHFMCKDVAVLPNGMPIVLTENGEAFILASLSKILAHSSIVQSKVTEMLRLVNQQGIIIQSISAASGISSDTPVNEMILWGVSDQYNDETKGYAVYQGLLDFSSEEPQIYWENLGFTADKVSLHRHPDEALILSSFGQVYQPRKI